jgi:hypothetical protein
MVDLFKNVMGSGGGSGELSEVPTNGGSDLSLFSLFLMSISHLGPRPLVVDVPGN